MIRPTPRALVALTCALLCVVLLGACGSGGGGASGATAPSGARAGLRRTLAATSGSVDRARVVASLRLDPEGLLKLAGPIALRVAGPFAAPTGDAPARFDLALLATLGGSRFHAAAISTGTRRYLRLDDRAYTLKARRRRGAGRGPHPLLASFGIDPQRWVTDVRDQGSEQVAGVATEHLAGDVDAKRLLADVGSLLDAAGGPSGAILSPDLLGQIGDAVKTAKVDVWTGAADGILRQLAVTVTFRFKDAQSPIVGLDGGRLTLRVRLDDVNGAPVQVSAPSGARPLTELTGSGGLRAVIAGLGAGISGGIGGGAIELAGCVSKADGSSVDLFACVAKLAP